jgi:hypothetical protein
VVLIIGYRDSTLSWSDIWRNAFSAVPIEGINCNWWQNAPLMKDPKLYTRHTKLGHEPLLCLAIMWDNTTGNTYVMIGE